MLKIAWIIRAYQKIKSCFRLLEISHSANHVAFLKEQYALLMSADNGLHYYCLKIHSVFTARQISTPCENDRFSFVIDHSQPNRETNEANMDGRSGFRSNPVSNERENESTNSIRPPAITGHGFAWKLKKKLFFPLGVIFFSSFSLFLSLSFSLSPSPSLSLVLSLLMTCNF